VYCVVVVKSFDLHPVVTGSNPVGSNFFKKKNLQIFLNPRFPKILAKNLESTAAVLLFYAKGIRSAM